MSATDGNTPGRLVPLTPDQLDPAQQALHDSIGGGRRAAVHGRALGLVAADGSLVGPFDAYLRQPVIGARLAELGEALRFDTTLRRDLLELAVLVVARHTSAEFEWFAHSRLALAAGLPAEVVDALRHGREPELDDPELVLAHRFARQLVTGYRVDDATYAEAVERLGEPATFELTALIGFYGCVSAVLNTFQVPLPVGVEPLPPLGAAVEP